MTTALDIASILPWSEPREISHLNKTVRNAEPTDSFRTIWAQHQPELLAAGVGWSEWPKGSGKWRVSWWQPLAGAVTEARAASAELSRAASSDFEPPRPNGLRFYPFQKAGIDFIRRRPGSLLADDMGIGKTIQAIGLINCDPSIKRVLVVTKASLKENWSRELRRWLTRRFCVGVVNGSPRTQLTQRLQRLFAFNDQEWENGLEEDSNAILLGQQPGIQIAFSLNSFLVQGDTSSNSCMIVPSKPKQPVNQPSIRLVNADDPLRGCLLTVSETNTPLAVENASQVSSICQSFGSGKNSTSATPIDQRETPLSPVPKQCHVRNTEFPSEFTSRQTSSVSLKAKHDNCIRNTCFHGFCLIVNYDLLHKYHKQLRVGKWDLVILDESAAIKNRDAKRTLAVIGRKAAPRKGLEEIPPIPARFRLCLSGTPIENRPEELWTTLYFLDPARWGSFWSYAKRYCGMASNGFGVDTSGATNLDELQRILRETIMIRRRKADVLTELPPKTRIVVEMETDGLEDVIAEEGRTFNRFREDLEAAQTRIELARASDSDEEFKAAVKGLASSTVAFTEMARVRHATAVAKVPAMIESIQADIEETGRKLIVFGHHRDVLQPLAAAFPGSLLITGETPAELRQGICDRFQTDPNCGPFFGSIRACGEGLTLTAAKLVVFAEEDWVPGKVSQAEDRAHRIGQRDNVLVKHYVLPGTIDARMIQTIVAKQEIIDQALDTDPGEWANEPVLVPHHQPVGKRKEIAEEALLITAAQRDAIHAALQRLAGMCDGALKLDDAEFNKIDANIGHALAGLAALSPRQAALGKRICRKYVRQLGQETINAMGT
jgi:hypothetical protein